MPKEISESAMLMLITESMQCLLKNVVEQGGTDDVLVRRQEAMGFRVGVGIMERLMKERSLLKLSRREEPKEAVRYLCREFWPFAFKKPMDALKMNKQGDVFIVKAANFKYLQHVCCAGVQLYAPGTRGLLAREVIHDGVTFHAGLKLVITSQQMPSGVNKSIVSASDGVEFEALIEGHTVPLGLDDFTTDTLPRLNPLTLLYFPAGMLRGALYALGVVAAVEPKREDETVMPAGVDFVITARVGRGQ